MDKKESKRQLVTMLESGHSKTEIFKTLSGGEVKDRVLAYWIGAYADPALCQRHSGKIKTLLFLTIAQALLGAVFGFLLGSMIGPGAAVFFTLFAAGVPLLFAWGFYKNVAQAYTIYVILSLSQFPRMFQGFEEDPLLTLVGAGITLGMVFFVAYLKTLLFPDLGFLGSKKVKGHYVFSS
ncbi:MULTISPECIES: hypothetical protein [Gammaproteobacteria]|uniref:hypothetical protein n=1 Tax=Gammaproteobacteria TaxID=1236 RepID=UPI001914D566|nr:MULTISPECIES: hypothetical protein [Gammaproteobacteria]MBK5302058.1 hypothetical protein [Bacillus sp. TH86]MBK5321827.1 hypothetical protein [Bacillus sp. TH59]MBK5336777.1 hypothetical protein [Bacillus sp. TH57]MBK5310840.1 hypothetical protein [Pseudomonas sp. TH71]MBK5316324.1 hypothetical protein [Erwinia sp. TH79]